MPKFNLICIKAVRLTGWLLVVPIALYFLSGWAMSGDLDLSWLDYEKSHDLHGRLAVPFLILFALHMLPAMWLAVFRWTRRLRNNGATSKAGN